jgi:hypothetical protein
MNFSPEKKEEVPKIETSNVVKIDLGQFRTDESAKVFAGRKRGAFCRTKLGLEEFDKSGKTIIISIPLDIYSMNSAFFLNLFGKSIRVLGEERFLGKYNFEGPSEVLAEIPNYIKMALKDPNASLI